MVNLCPWVPPSFRNSRDIKLKPLAKVKGPVKESNLLAAGGQDILKLKPLTASLGFISFCVCDFFSKARVLRNEGLWFRAQGLGIR